VINNEPKKFKCVIIIIIIGVENTQLLLKITPSTVFLATC
jgi:hypothetical protein